MGGDFNIALNPALDRWNPKSTEPSKMASRLSGMMKDYNLIDIWRIRHPDMKRYTWRCHEPVLKQSRIDLFLVSDTITPNINYIEIELSYISDHSMISLHINPLSESERGAGYWKFNSSLLDNKDYVNLVNETIQNFNDNRTNARNSATLNWDLLKMNIRRETIMFAKNLAKKRRKREKELLETLKTLEEEISNLTEDNENLKDLHQITKQEYEQLENQKTRGIMLRSKARWVEEGEKNSKYFLNLEKHNQEIKNIKILKDSNGKDIDNREEILEYIKDFYMKLYSENPEVSKNINDFKEFVSDKSLNIDDSAYLDRPFTENEIFEAVKDLPKNKTPGIDGFNKEFYEYFWDKLKMNFLKMLADVFINQSLSIDQKRGVINLIPKQDKDLKYVSNWRPISILNTDYKIITKALANRIKGVLPNLINEDQTGFVLGRLIGQNIRIVKDVMDYCNTMNIEGLLVMLDFEKAFDSLNWEFITYVLEQFNFGINFIKWVQILYTDISSSVQNNGSISDKFKLNRGIRQGCPLSAFVFILCAELLAT
jgi:hypothetical protein